MRRQGRTDEEFTAYAGATASRLRDTAYLMCRDWHLAEDLTQAALLKLYLAWPRVREVENVDAYARTVLTRSFLDHRRRRSSTEVASDALPETPVGDQPDLRLTLVDALATLAPLDRAIVVLRHWEDHSVAQVADMLGLSQGAVKNRSMRALATLREQLPGVALT